MGTPVRLSISDQATGIPLFEVCWEESEKGHSLGRLTRILAQLSSTLDSGEILGTYFNDAVPIQPRSVTHISTRRPHAMQSTRIVPPDLGFISTSANSLIVVSLLFRVNCVLHAR